MPLNDSLSRLAPEYSQIRLRCSDTALKTGWPALKQTAVAISTHRAQQ